MENDWAASRSKHVHFSYQWLRHVGFLYSNELSMSKCDIKVKVTEVLKMMCPCLVLIKERSLGCGRVNYYSQPLVSVCHGKDGSR